MSTTFKIFKLSTELILQCIKNTISYNVNEIIRIYSDTRNIYDVDIEIISSLPNNTSGEECEEITNIKCYGIYGIYLLLSGPYLAMISNIKPIGYSPKKENNNKGDIIYLIEDIELIPISTIQYQTFLKTASKQEKKDELKYLSMIKSIIKTKTFYISYEYQLTLTCQAIQFQEKVTNTPNIATTFLSTASSNCSASLPSLWEKAETSFFWNKPLLNKFIKKNLSNWIVPIINGYVKYETNCEIIHSGKRIVFDILFITRRSWKRVGTRFNVRGVDKDGNTANYAETEIIIIKDDGSIISYVQTRGSIPLYWDQLPTLKYMPRTRYAISMNENALDWNELAFTLHFDKLVKRYGKIIAVNLIDRTGKSSTVRDQAQLGSAYGKYVKKYNQVYAASAFEASNNRNSITHANANMITQIPNTPLKKNPFSSSFTNRNVPISPKKSSQSRSILNMPSAIDNSDNTRSKHVINDDIVRYIWFDFHHECRNMKWSNLSKLLEEVENTFATQGCFQKDSAGRPIERQKGVFRVNCMDNLDRTNVVMSLFARRAILTALKLYDPSSSNVLDSPYSVFERYFKNLWADNADVISIMYAGTPALKTDFTRTGKRTLHGAINDGINSVIRYYLNNFDDGIRQDSLDLFVGNYVPDKRLGSPFTFQQLHSVFNMIIEIFIINVMYWIIISHICNNFTKVEYYYSMALCTYILFVLLILYSIVKKGKLRSLGRRFVCKPSFCTSGYIRPNRDDNNN